MPTAFDARSLPLPTSPTPPRPPAGTPAAARAVFGLLRALRHGLLEVQLPDGNTLVFGGAAEGAPRAALRLRNWAPCAAALRSGDIGLADTFVAGDWTTPDLPALLGLFIANRESLEALVYGRWWGSLLHRVRHLLRRNSRAGSRRNIHAHYDIGNAFYRLWLDETMNYSSAWYEGASGADGAVDCVAAQRAKMRRALRECRIAPGERLLEIGCGWGALAECAATEFGAQVTGVTLSSEQLAWGQRRVAAAGANVTLRLQDYRDIEDGPFDAVVSIEMFEAVGRAYWPGFFETLRRQLKPGGRACIQTIVIRDDLFARYADSTDFIQQTIFPGGLLPSRAEFRAECARAGLSIVDELDFGADYAETLTRWRARFLAQEAEVRALGFDTRFVRTWDFYLAYCQAAFAEGNTSVVQFSLER